MTRGLEVLWYVDGVFLFFKSIDMARKVIRMTDIEVGGEGGEFCVASGELN